MREAPPMDRAGYCSPAAALRRLAHASARVPVAAAHALDLPEGPGHRASQERGLSRDRCIRPPDQAQRDRRAVPIQARRGAREQRPAPAWLACRPHARDSVPQGQPPVDMGADRQHAHQGGWLPGAQDDGYRLHAARLGVRAPAALARASRADPARACGRVPGWRSQPARAAGQSRVHLARRTGAAQPDVEPLPEAHRAGHPTARRAEPQDQSEDQA